MSKISKYGTPLLILGFIAFYFYQQEKDDKEFKSKLRQIEITRLALEDSVKVLQLKTIERDKNLRSILRRNLEIIDTLNVTLKRLNANSKDIERKIEETKTKIDELWKTN